MLSWLRMSPVRTQIQIAFLGEIKRTIPWSRPASGRAPRAGLVQDAACGTGAQRRLVLDETEHGAMLVQVGPPASSKTVPPLRQCGVRLQCRPIGQQRSCCDDQLNPPNTPRSSSASAAARLACVPRWARSAMRMTTPCARASSPPSNASCSIAGGSRRRPRRDSAVFAFIEGFYNPRRRHSSIGYLSPIDYERRHHAAAVVPDAHQPAAVLAAVKDKPCGRPQEAAVLDRRCARQPRHCAGRDERMAPRGAEPKNATKQEDSMPSDHIA